MRRPSRHRRLALPAVAVALVACTTPSTIPRVEAAPDQADLVGRWHDRSGTEVPDGHDGTLTLQTAAASTSCGLADVTVFMELAWPVGSRADIEHPRSPTDSYSYVRDPHGSYWTDAQPDLDTELPTSAESSGFRRAGNELYVKPGNPSAVWVHRPDGHVERWPRQKTGTGCA